MDQSRFPGNRSSRSSSVSTLGRHPDLVEGVIDLTLDESPNTNRLFDGEYALANIRVGGETIRVGDCVEVQDLSLEGYPIEFIIVKIIAEQRFGDRVIRGIPLARTKRLNGKLPKKANEVCQILRYSDTASSSTPRLMQASASSVVKKRTMILTNTIWPDHRCNDFADIQDEQQRSAARAVAGTIVCRWVYKLYPNENGDLSTHTENVLERVGFDDTLPQYRKPTDTLCIQWRGGRTPGGSSGALPPSHQRIDLTGEGNPNARLRHRAQGQIYTVLDSFSGARGVSRGATMSGFSIAHAIDNDRDVWDTYSTNFPETKLCRGSISDFMSQNRRHIRVDILHLSPPCQFFSPAHTKDGRNDQQNIDASTSCSALIHKVRPRLITLEQTFGIAHNQHNVFFSRLISDIAFYGYSVRWKVVKLCTWGSAQDRKRLILIAAAPGEELPPFPQPTHSEGGAGRLKPFNTIRRAIRRINPRDSLHDLATVHRYDPRRVPYNADRLAGTLTTSGATFAHPDGHRQFTLREFACLQGFPRNHVFIGNRTSVKKQIGNAFPADTVKVLYDHLHRWLLQKDGMSPYEAPAADPIVLTEDEDFIIVSDSDAPSLGRRSDSNARRDDSPATDDFVDFLNLMDIDDEDVLRREQ